MPFSVLSFSATKLLLPFLVQYQLGIIFNIFQNISKYSQMLPNIQTWFWVHIQIWVKYGLLWNIKSWIKLISITHCKYCWNGKKILWLLYLILLNRGDSLIQVSWMHTGISIWTRRVHDNQKPWLRFVGYSKV